MSSMFVLPQQYVPDNSGQPLMGARANFYVVGTTTRKNTYIDAALSEAHPNPVQADSYGVFPQIWLDEGGTDYRVVITDQFDVAQYTIDGLLSQTTPSDLLNQIITVDGAGSLLDADLLDGLNGTEYAKLDTDETVTGEWNYTNDLLLFGIPVGYRGIPIRSKTAQHTLVKTDNGYGISSTTGGLVIPVTSSEPFNLGPFDVGHVSVFINDSAVNQQITAATPATTTLKLAGTLTSGSPRTVAPNGVVVLWQYKLNTWMLYGAGSN